jgi:hypothetical protein
MLSIFISFIFISFIFIIFGKSFSIKFDSNNEYGLIESYFIGLCLGGGFLNAWSIFFPTNIYSFLFLLVISIILIWYFKKPILNLFQKTFNSVLENKLLYLTILLALIFFAIKVLDYPRLYDSLLYHIGAIQWNEKYSVVPGLANIHDRFGFNSSMFVISSGFQFTEIFGQQIFAISALSFFFLIIWGLKIGYKNWLINLFLLVYIYFFTAQYSIDISSPGTDLLPNILYSFLIIYLIVDGESIKKKKILFILIPLYIFTLKVSFLSVLIIPFYTCFINYKIRSFVLSLSIYFGIMLLPWIIRNIYISGYLIYPSTFIDIFNFDWKVPAEMVNETKGWVHSFAKIPYESYEVVNKMSFVEWFVIWWSKINLINTTIFILTTVSLVYLSIKLTLNFKKLKTELLVLIVLFSGFIFWLFNAPDFRFCFSILILSIFFALREITKKINTLQVINDLTKYFQFVFMLFLMFAFSFSNEFRFSELKQHFFLGKDIAKLKHERRVYFDEYYIKNQENENILFYIPKNKDLQQCYDVFPCSHSLNDKVIMRGKSIQDGFKKMN